jgi:ABC-type cobalamin/Fe3+-siderophores transport system ATPase subunit
MNLITRPIIKKIKGQLEKGDIVGLIGARQVGKTSILKCQIKFLPTFLASMIPNICQREKLF